MNGEGGQPLVPRSKQRLGGVLILLIGVAGTVWTWQQALDHGEDSLHAALLFPAIVVTGLGLLLFPGYAEERVARGEDISELSGAQLITTRWWIILAIAIAARLGNYLLLTRG